MREVSRQGIGFLVVATWPGTRYDERRLKRRKNSPKLCPVCQPAPWENPPDDLDEDEAAQEQAAELELGAGPGGPARRRGGGVMAGQNRRQCLVADVDRTRRHMVAVIADARRAEVEVPIGVTASIEVWRSWGQQLAEEES
jgi:hypothetical protein